MTSKPRLSDDYIASLLAQDAAEFIKNPIYKSSSASNAQKPDEKRKPNTRFLQNLIRETDGFNAALLKKERDEHLDRARERERSRRREHSSREHRRSRSRDRHESRRHREHRRDRRRSRSRSRSPTTRSRRAEKSQSTLKRRSRSRSKERPRRKDRRRSRSRSKERYKERRARSVSSDPLEEIVGPTAPPQTRGRGMPSAYGSTLDAKFDASYNPAQDIHQELDEERDDWDNALEALKDQHAWKRSQKDRMIAAGFSEKELEKWEKSSHPAAEQSDLSQVRWTKSGVGREWDRGKVLDSDGNVQMKAPFS